MPKKPIPRFKSEADEAGWWAMHQDSLEDYVEFLPEGDLDLAEKMGLPTKEAAIEQARQARAKFATKAISLKMPVDDLEQARRIARRKGLPYQTLLKSMIHEGLQRLDKEAL